VGTRRLIVVPALLLAAGCAANAATTGGAAPARSSAVVLAVSTKSSPALAVYRVGRDRTATLLTRVEPPQPGERAVSWTLSGGDKPDLCVAWRAGARGELWCYPFGRQGSPVDLQRRGAPGVVALRPDGAALAWTVESGTVQDLVTAEYGKGTATKAKVLEKGRDPGFWVQEHVLGIAWASDHVLVLERPRVYGRSGGYQLLDVLRVPPGGWGENALGVDPTAPDSGRGFDYLTGVQAATIDWVLALEGGSCEAGCAHAPATRAVRAAIGDGRVLEVVATAPPGQVVTSVSGAADSVVWTARAGSTVRVHLRLKGETAAPLVGGLPAGVDRVVAAP
jgi:hypothetical protein